MWPPEPRTIKVFAAEVRFAAFVFRFGTTHQSRAITTITKPINEAKYQVIALPSIALKCSSGARRVPATSQQKRNFKGFCEFERNKGCANKPYSTMVEFKESLQYHNFFQKIYSHGNKDDICFGMGLLVPRVPFLFQTIPEKRTPDPLKLVLLTLYYLLLRQVLLSFFRSLTSVKGMLSRYYIFLRIRFLIVFSYRFFFWSTDREAQASAARPYLRLHARFDDKSCWQ